MADYKTHLDLLFEGADALMWELSEAEGYFTNYAFIRRAAQRHQGAYVNLLKTVLDHRGEAYLFNIAHQSIGGQLSHVAQKAGYEQRKNQKIQEFNIFGDVTPCVIYVRTERVTRP